MGLLDFFIGFLKRISKLLIYFTFVVTLVLLIPNLPPYTKFSNIQTVPTKERTGGLTPNTILNNAGKLYEKKLLGPENFQIWKGELYTSLATGEIVKCSPGGHITFVTKIGQPCIGLAQEHICGRPLGFSIDEKNGVLYVADAYYGIWKVDLKTDKKQVLVSADTVIGGRTPRLFNSLVVDRKGGIYFTDSSSDFSLKDGVFTSLSDPSGRLLYHNPATKENKVLVDNIWFANGVALSPDESFIVIAETMNYRLLKHYISGPKKGKTEVFVDGLPGVPDNLRALPDGSGLQIAMYAVSNVDTPIITKSLSGTPHLRKFISRLAHLIEIPFSYLNRQFPHPILEEIEYSIGSFKSVSGLTDESGLIITNWDGFVITSYYNTDKSVAHISDAIVYNNKLVLGAPHSQDYIGVVDVPPLLKQAYTIKAQKSAEGIATMERKPEVKETPKSTHKTTTQTPQTKPTIRQPETKSTTRKPETKPATQKPENKPETKPVTQTPETKSATQKPETKPVTQKHETKPVTLKPETKPASQKPETKPATQKSETKPVAQKPETKPEMKPNTQKLATKSTHQPSAQKPQIKPNPTLEKVTISPAEAVQTDTPKAPMKKSESKREVVKEETMSRENHIPIEEEIISDTAKPNRDKLKVIKKSGPEEIPNPI